MVGVTVCLLLEEVGPRVDEHAALRSLADANVFIHIKHFEVTVDTDSRE